MACRLGCGGCCISISISSALPGLPHGKVAGARCLHLSSENHCGLWGTVEFPDVCRKFMPDPLYCGETNAEALALLTKLELATMPALVVK